MILYFFFPQHLLAGNPIDSIQTTPTYQEIPYYLRKLEETDGEGKRMEFLRLIHEAVIHADLSDRRVVKKMEPMLIKIQSAIQNGLDRPNLGGQMGWLGSAVDYFEHNKRRPTLFVSTAAWLGSQSESLNGLEISSFPEKILLHDKPGSTVLIESSNIHEAVIDPTGRRVAFFRTNEEAERVEIWMVDLKSRKPKKISELVSCYTLLFSLNGKYLYLQERPKGGLLESTIYRLSSSGGRAQPIHTGALLETVIKEGPYKGALVIYKRTKHPLGLPDPVCPFLVNESGEEVGRLGGAACR